ASALQAEGRGFESLSAHQRNPRSDSLLPLESGRFSLLLAANVKTRPSQITIFYINSHAKSKAETAQHIL
ncbi:hypothetical protein, partial [Duncaniella muris]|uniref:hypothetical protein n=1 Tax=Duncaniella muris TaxID=2094150 RepID=UPI00271456AC